MRAKPSEHFLTCPSETAAKPQCQTPNPHLFITRTCPHAPIYKQVAALRAAKGLAATDMAALAAQQARDQRFSLEVDWIKAVPGETGMRPGEGGGGWGKGRGGCEYQVQTTPKPTKTNGRGGEEGERRGTRRAEGESREEGGGQGSGESRK